MKINAINFCTWDESIDIIGKDIIDRDYFHKDLLDKINTIILTNFSKFDKFDKLKILIDVDAELRASFWHPYHKEIIFVALWLYYLRDADAEATIFNPKTSVLLEEITHFVDDKIGFSNRKEFIKIMQSERMNNKSSSIDKLFQFVYLMAFSFDTQYGLERRQWQKMIATSNSMYLEAMHPIKEILSKLWNRKHLTENTSIESSLPILAREYLFDLMLAQKALKKYYENPTCLEKLFNLDNKHKFDSKPTDTIKSIIQALNLNNFKSANEVLQAFVPESYKCLRNFESKVK